VLHITNGDTAVEVLRAAGVPGDILPWRDVLHEGPVDARLSFQELSRRRIDFIAEAGWAARDDVELSFLERDERLTRSPADDEVVLWFEHDLYDQLQLIQLLDWFGRRAQPKLSLVCEAEYLGRMLPERAASLFEKRAAVSEAQLRQGRSAWEAFGSSDPLSIKTDSSEALPFLGPALRRHLEEFPWQADGLSRTERQVLEALGTGALQFNALFAATQAREDPVFLGDTTLLWHLERMREEGLLEWSAGFWRASGQPRAKRLPRWLGGALVDERARWRWDPVAAQLCDKHEKLHDVTASGDSARRRDA
jgi:hypothetical protein